MNDIMVKVIELVIIILAVLIGRYIVPLIKTNVDFAKLRLICEWALKFVKTAELLIEGSGQGEIKRSQVTIWLTNKAKELGINLTDEQIRVILEDAYTTMINESKNESK